MNETAQAPLFVALTALGVLVVTAMAAWLQPQRFFRPHAASAATVSTPSFDCDVARNWDEQQICADSSLAASDQQLANDYRQAMRSAKGKPEARALRADQRNWLIARRRCQFEADPIGCLRKKYADRTLEFVPAGAGS